MFRLINLDTITVLAYSFRDIKIYALLNWWLELYCPIRLETLRVPPFSFRDSKFPGIFFRDSKNYALLN